MGGGLDFVMVNTLTDRMFGGNKLAVFPEAEHLSNELMQAVSRELDMSATYVSRPASASHTRDIRIFTPEAELPFAGHPTIGTAVVLHSLGLLRDDPTVRNVAEGSVEIILGERAGAVPVQIQTEDDLATAVLTSPRLPAPVEQALNTPALAAVLGLTDAEVGTAWLPGCFSAGMPFTFIPIRDRNSLSRIRINRDVWTKVLRDSAAPKIYAFTLAEWRDGRDVHARMFPPDTEVVEDPAAAGAAVAFGGYLADRQAIGEGRTTWHIHQGLDMGRPSLIQLEVQKRSGQISTIRVGGAATIFASGSMRL